MFGEITKEKADEMGAAWDAASLSERLTMDRVSWISTDTTSYFVTRPSELERKAAARIAELDAALKTLLYEMERMAERADVVADDEGEAMFVARKALVKSAAPTSR